MPTSNKPSSRKSTARTANEKSSGRTKTARITGTLTCDGFTKADAKAICVLVESSVEVFNALTALRAAVTRYEDDAKLNAAKAQTDTVLRAIGKAVQS